MMRCFILLTTLFASSMLTGRDRNDNKQTNSESRELKGHTGSINCVASQKGARFTLELPLEQS